MYIKSQELFTLKNYVYFPHADGFDKLLIRCEKPSFDRPENLSDQQELALEMLMNTTLGVSTLAFKKAGIKCPHKVIQAVRQKGAEITCFKGLVVDDSSGKTHRNMNIYYFHTKDVRAVFTVYDEQGFVNVYERYDVI